MDGLHGEDVDSSVQFAIAEDWVTVTVHKSVESSNEVTLEEVARKAAEQMVDDFTALVRTKSSPAEASSPEKTQPTASSAAPSNTRDGTALAGRVETKQKDMARSEVKPRVRSSIVGIESKSPQDLEKAARVAAEQMVAEFEAMLGTQVHPQQQGAPLALSCSKVAQLTGKALVDFMGGEEAVKKSVVKGGAKAAVRKSVVGVEDVCDNPLKKAAREAAEQMVEDFAAFVQKKGGADVTLEIIKEGGSQAAQVGSKEVAKASIAAGLTSGVVGLVTNSVVDLGYTVFVADESNKWTELCGRFGRTHVPSAVVDVGTETAVLAAGTVLLGPGAVVSWPFVGATMGIRFVVTAVSGY